MKKISTSLICLLFFLLSSSVWASLKDLVETKSKNYQSLDLYYNSLLDRVIAKDKK